MTDLMWAAVKEPLETHFTFDKEGLDLAFKYFTCSTLTIRLAGIAQINVRFTVSISNIYDVLIFTNIIATNIL
jgi:ubiquitin carboxyl-terminal hydrolase 34